MMGRLEYAPGGWGRGRREELYGLPVLLARVEPEGIFAAGRLRRAGKSLRRGGVGRVLAPAGFAGWAELGLRPVEPGPLLKACAPELAVAWLRGRDRDPRGATVALRGQRTEPELVRAAVRLCPRVRNLVIDTPAGERLARRLREEFGVPVLPSDHPAQLTLRFHPGGGEAEGLELFGAAPKLGGLKLEVPELGGEDRDRPDVLCALWEGGRLDLSRVKIRTN